MKNITKFLAVGAVALGLSSQAMAVPIVGSVSIGAAVGTTVSVDTTANTVAFSPQNATNAQLTVGTLDFSVVQGAIGNYQNFTYSPLTVSNPIWSFTSGANTATFSLSSISFIDESAAGVVLRGTGTATLTGKDASLGSWSFSADNSGTAFFAWSSTATVPDGGSTALLMGAAFVAAFAARRFRFLK